MSINFQKLYLKSCNSTNDLLKNKEFHTQSMAVYTFHQTKGRGQEGKYWDNNQGQNIAISFGIPSKLLKINQVQLSMAMAIFIRHFLNEFLTEKVKIKWPNDIIITHKKIAGILIEKVKNYYIIGIGININQLKFNNLPNAISLASITQESYDLKELSDELIRKLEDFFPFETSQLLPLYNHYLYQINSIQNFEIDNQKRSAIIKGVNSEGHLILDLKEQGEQNYRHGEISWIF